MSYYLMSEETEEGGKAYANVHLPFWIVLVVFALYMVRTSWMTRTMMISLQKFMQRQVTYRVKSKGN